MAIEFFDSLLGEYYGKKELNQQTVLEARRELKSILGEEPLRVTLSSQRSLLQQAIAGSGLIFQKEFETVEEWFAGNVGLVSSAKAAYDAAVLAGTGIEGAGETLAESITDFVEGFNSNAVHIIAGRLSIQSQNVKDSVGLLPTEWSNVVAQDIVELSDLAIGITVAGGVNIAQLSFSLLSEAYNLIPFISNFSTWGDIASFIVNLETGLIPTVFNFIGTLFSNPIKLISDGVSAIYDTLIVRPGISDMVVDFFETKIDPDTYLSTSLFSELALGIRESIIEDGLVGTAGRIATEAIGTLAAGAGNILSNILEEVKDWEVGGVTGESVISGVTNFASGAIDFITQFISSDEVRITLESVGELLTSLFPSYIDGVSETRFGTRMERSWIGSQNSFLNNLRSVNVNIIATTPLDPSENENASLYGNLMLGAPPTYTRVTDPNNRAMINTFVKDSTFLSLTPGLPKYNGGAFQQEITQQVGSLFSSQASTYLNQTDTPDEMVAYLLKNGLDLEFAEKDKRYYTFEQDYEQYYAYLETMLNALWIKMGLGTAEDGSLNIYSFFNPSSNSSDYDSTLRDKYRSSIGFFVNPENGVSEGIGNQTVSSDLSNAANSRSDEFQRINYITGMGTGGDARNIMRQVGIGIKQAQAVGQVVRDALGGAKSIFDVGGRILEFSNTQDMSAIMQQFSVTNGMKVIYPDLWTSSNYSKNMNFSFNFVSPYGDPLSIFQYVYVPFFSILAFAMPRQAAENGLVTPFLVRADMPGIITSDLAMITQVDWVKGGAQGLFTKDKLPRAISGTFTVQDLYPYLAATKRLSFLSANPSYTVFLDNMAGLRAVYNEAEDDPYAEYWKKMINRVSGTESNQGLWNRFDPARQAQNINYAAAYQRPSLTKTISKKAAPWLSKV
jgi:hypothetical protein